MLKVYMSYLLWFWSYKGLLMERMASLKEESCLASSKGVFFLQREGSVHVLARGFLSCHEERGKGKLRCSCSSKEREKSLFSLKFFFGRMSMEIGLPQGEGMLWKVDSIRRMLCLKFFLLLIPK